MVVFARIDDRVIHGQTMVMWFADYPCDGVVIIDDELSNNPVMSEIYKGAVSSDIRVHIFTTQTAIDRMSEVQNSAKRYILIFKSVLTLCKMIGKCDFPIKEVNVGPNSKRANTVEIVPTISLDPNEINSYHKISDAGIKTYFQIIPSSKKLWWDDVKKMNKF